MASGLRLVRPGDTSAAGECEPPERVRRLMVELRELAHELGEEDRLARPSLMLASAFETRLVRKGW